MLIYFSCCAFAPPQTDQVRVNVQHLARRTRGPRRYRRVGTFLRPRSHYSETIGRPVDHDGRAKQDVPVLRARLVGHNMGQLRRFGPRCALHVKPDQSRALTAGCRPRCPMTGFRIDLSEATIASAGDAHPSSGLTAGQRPEPGRNRRAHGVSMRFVVAHPRR